MKLSGSMLQRGCVAGDSGVPCDISVGILHTTNYPATFATFCGAEPIIQSLFLADAGRSVIQPLRQAHLPAKMGGACTCVELEA